MKLIVCDIEGCLMPAEREVVNAADLAEVSAYCAAAQNNRNLPPMVFCTGRQIPYAECVAQLIGVFFPGFPSVVENGAFLYDIANNEVIRNPAINEDVIGELREVRERVEEIVSTGNARKEYGKEICISLNPLGSSIEELFEVTQKELQPWASMLNITHSKSAVDITPVGVDKTSAVRFLAERVGVDLSEILGIGDTRGDLPMLKIVGMPTGPANATDDVREVSKFIASSEGPKGVAEILRKFTDWN